MNLLDLLTAFLASIGRSTLGLLGATGRLTIFAGLALSNLVRRPFYPVELGRQLLDIGYYLAAGRRPDRDLHRHGAGAAELYRLRPLQRRHRDAHRSSSCRHHPRARPGARPA